MPQTNLHSFFSRPKQDPAVTSVNGEVLGAEPTPQLLESRGEGNSLTKTNTDTNPNTNMSCKESQPSILAQVQKHASSEVHPVTVAHLPLALVVPLLSWQVPSIQRLTNTTLPIRYSDAFFRESIDDATLSQLTRIVLYSLEPVGWMRCRLEEASPKMAHQPQLHQIYIQALALLAPYRGLGLATILLDTILNSPVAKDQTTVSVYAHVWEKNEDALEWYAKRGFSRVILVERYYRRLNPGGAWIVRKELH